MIIKSFLILSIVFNSLGMHGVADKFDRAVVRDMTGAQKVVEASDFPSIVLPEIMPLPTVRPMAPKASANATNYILVDSDSGVVVAGKNQKIQVPIASTTKIMSAVIALENYKLDEVATISATATSQIPSVAYLKTGEQITIENLLNCMLIPSGNDAAYAIAEHMSNDIGGTEKFITRMNEKAKELGMTNTHYADPAGLDANGTSTAYDLYLVTKYALKNPVFRQIVGRSSYVAKNVNGTIFHSLKQSNRLVTNDYMGAIGVKTGFTEEAGHCLVGAATRDGHTLIAVVLKTFSTAPTASADEAKRLLDWGFTNIVWE